MTDIFCETKQPTIEAGLADLQSFIDGNFTDYEEFSEFLMGAVEQQSLPSALEAIVSQYIEDAEDQLSMSAYAYDAESYVASTAMGAAEGYLDRLTYYYKYTGETSPAGFSYGQPANQNISSAEKLANVGTTAQAVKWFGVALGLATAAAKVYDSSTPLDEAGKQSLSFGTGVWAGTAASGAVLAVLGLTAATATAVPLVGAAAVGTVVGMAVSSTVEKMWDAIITDVNASKSSSLTRDEAIEHALSNLLSDAQDIFDAPTAADFNDALDPDSPFCNDPMPSPYPERLTPGWLAEPLGLFGTAPSQNTPLVLDLDGDGVELTTFISSATTTFFDTDGDGFAEQTAWVGADDGLLVRDINSNGTIDGPDELFGSATIDGFAKLALLDSNGDRAIDQYDDAWGSLLVWNDANGDAVTQDGELLTLSSLDIVSIDLAGVTASSSTINGNQISHTSTFRYSDNSTDMIVDAWFVNDDVNSYYTGSYTLDIRALFLPTLRGFGEIPDLHISMSMDEDLLDLVTDFVDNWDWSRFADASGLDSDLEDILFTWAGVDGVSPTSRGPNIDARKLEFLENIFAEDFLQYGYHENPFPNAANTLTLAWSQLLGNIKAQLIIQMGGAELFDDTAAYDVFAGELTGDLDLSQSAINDLVAFATDTGVDTEDYWLQVVQFVDYAKGLANVTSTEEGWLDTALSNSGLSDTWDDIVDTYESIGIVGGISDYGTSGNDTITGSAGSDTLYGYSGNDIISGGNGGDYIDGEGDDDTLYGEAGNDEIYGRSGNDVLSAGSGGDYVNGGEGNDTYIYTSGDDVYSEYAQTGSDEIDLPSGIDSSDVTFFRANSDSLFVGIDGLGSIEIPGFFQSSGNQIETLKYYDTSTVDLTSLTAYDYYGSAGADTMTGQSGVAEHLFGFDGNDTLIGGGGNDQLDGGVGNDLLAGNDGDDTYYLSPGFDTIDDVNGVSGGGSDTIVIPEGFTVSDLTALKSGSDDVLLTIADLGQTLVEWQLSGGGGTIEYIYFAETDTTVNFTDLSIEIRGTSGNDSLTGTSGYGVSTDDILNGLAGDDTLQGGAGDDTYVFSEGSDLVYEASGSSDRIFINNAWSVADIDIYRQQSVGWGWDDLVIADQNGNKITIESQFDDSGSQVEYVEFLDSTVWDLLSMDIEVWGTSGNDSISISDPGGVTIRSLGGNDSMSGYTGDDTYIFSAGLDSIYESGGTDTLWITGGATINDITVSDYNYYDTQIVVNASTDEVLIQWARQFSWLAVENIKFDDGFVADLPSYNSWTKGTSGGDTLSGSSGADVIIGYDGNDTIGAGAGSDAAHGGSGADAIHGGDGDDLLHGGAGDDVLYGDDGEDMLFGGSGADTFVLDAATAFNDVDVIEDFSASDNDVIDISDVLDGYFTSGVDDITDFVQITDDGTDSTLAIDQDGSANGTNFATVATLLGVIGLTDEAALVTSGNLLAA